MSLSDKILLITRNVVSMWLVNVEISKFGKTTFSGCRKPKISSHVDVVGLNTRSNKGDDLVATTVPSLNFQKAQELPGQSTTVDNFNGKWEQMEGEWYIRSAHNNLVLDVRDSNIRTGAEVVLASQRKIEGRSSQKWIFAKDHFIASASNPNLVMDIEGGGGAGTKIILWDKKSINDASNQRWDWAANGVIVSMRDTNLAFDVAGESKQEGTPLIVWTKKGSASNQIWIAETLTALNGYLM